MRPGKPDGFEGVRILLMHAYGMGGTIRTCLTLAEHLAAQGPVEVISIVRSRDEPFFAFPEGVTVTTLDDRRKGAPARSRLERVLAKLPSVLVHPDDHTYAKLSLLTDMRLLRRLRANARAASSSRRGRASTCLPRATRRPELTVVGQEHMNIGSHLPGLTTTSSGPTAGSMRSPCSPMPTAPTTRGCSVPRARASSRSRTRCRSWVAASRRRTAGSSSRQDGSRRRRASTC